MAARILVLLPAVGLLLAGCTGDSHSHPAGEPSLLLGIANDLDAPVNATWAVLTPAGEQAWAGSLTVEPAKRLERDQALDGEGDHTIRIAWVAGETVGNGTATYDPSECHGLSHIVFAISTDGLTEIERECHTD